MKKVAVLGDTLVGGNIFGVQRFAYEILREIDRINPDIEFVVVAPEGAAIEIEFENIKIVKYGSIRNSFLWRQLCFTEYLRKNDCIGLDMTLGLPYRGCDIVCLHDCTYELFDANFTTVKEKLRRKSYLIRAKHLAKTAKKIVTVSRHSKKELMSYYRLPSDKIEIVYNAWQHYRRIRADSSILDRLGIEKGNYYFSLGSGLKHKNLLWIVRAAINNPDETFIATGSDKFSDYLNEIGIKNIENIIYTGYISDEEVKGLMQSCKAVILPSFCEGFGIPPLEALSAGADIIVSNASCLPEIYEDAALYIDPYDYDINMDNYSDFPDESKKNNVLNKYSWAKSAEKMIGVINSVIR